MSGFIADDPPRSAFRTRCTSTPRGLGGRLTLVSSAGLAELHGTRDTGRHPQAPPGRQSASGKGYALRPSVAASIVHSLAEPGRGAVWFAATASYTTGEQWSVPE